MNADCGIQRPVTVDKKKISFAAETSSPSPPPDMTIYMLCWMELTKANN
jgi:hypothetical protein